MKNKHPHAAVVLALGLAMAGLHLADLLLWSGADTGFAALPIWFGVQGIRALKSHAGYSTGLLRSVVGISIGASFIIVEVVTLFMVIAFMMQRNAVR